MIIFGVDPGSVITGTAILSVSSKIEIIEYDAILLNKKLPQIERLKNIYEGCKRKIRKYKPEHLAIETAFYGKNIQSTLKLGQASGAAIVAALNSGLKVFEYSPREVKKSVTGNGAATKQLVKHFVKSTFTLKDEPKFLDSFDAIAVALCHYYHLVKQNYGIYYRGLNKKKYGKAWLEFIKDNPDKILN
ncbi:MAG: crossover junction endodeoxyribonuclease RuvC [Ignavibacteria bacterium]|nr:crossover junction endodeoxyribonuclease RuvC [Ignavibacteria bacterium]